MQLASIGSGSKGNGTLVRTDTTCVLVDCGFSLKETERRLALRSLSGADITAILVTHEHGDHIGGVGVLSRRYDIPVYMSHGTHLSGRCEDVYQRVCFDAGDAFRINDLDIQSVIVPHDARQPCQYVIEHQELKVGILTDLGSITPHVVESFAGCDYLLLEFNHELELLRVGPYPPPLKRRVGGSLGHLNNQQAADLLKQVDHEGLKSVLIAHISEQNNTREHIEAALRADLGGAFSKHRYMSQSEGYGWVQLDQTTGPREHQRVADV